MPNFHTTLFATVLIASLVNPTTAADLLTAERKERKSGATVPTPSLPATSEPKPLPLAFNPALYLKLNPDIATRIDVSNPRNIEEEFRRSGGRYLPADFDWQAYARMNNILARVHHPAWNPSKLSNKDYVEREFAYTGYLTNRKYSLADEALLASSSPVSESFSPEHVGKPKISGIINRFSEAPSEPRVNSTPSEPQVSGVK